MDRLANWLKSLTIRQRLIAGGGGAAALLVVAVMVKIAFRDEQALLYAGLAPQTAGEVISALDAEGIDYTVRGQGIFVPANDRDRLRLALAQQNLPAPSSQGYELLDQLDGFSTTSDMFSVTYWRAKEGELARTLMTMPGVTAARVHIGTPQSGRFSRSRSTRTASVTLTAPSGISDAQVRAVRYMTALAIPDLQAKDVAVIDNARGLLTAESGAMPEADNRRASALETALVSLLEARVGIGNARVQVAMDLVRRREEIESRAIDPDSAVLTSRNREESRSSEEGRDGAITVASDLPDGEAARQDRSSENQELREDVEYAVSTTDRRVEIMPGGIERLSVAVLINQPYDEDGSPIERSPEELQALGDLVRTAAGISDERGDNMTIRSLPFERPTDALAPDEPSLFESINPGRLAELGIIGTSALLFGLVVLRPLLKPTNAIPIGSSAALIEGDLLIEAPNVQSENPVEVLRLRSEERPDEAAALLNAWLDDKESAA